MDLILFFLLLICFVFALFAFSLSISFFLGPPFVPTPKYIVQEMLDLINISEKDILLDLGSGDGAILIEAAKRGTYSVGYEINPFLTFLTKLKARINRVHKNIEIHTQSYQKADMRNATIVFCYNLPRFMISVSKKIKKELPENSRVVSYKFPIRGLTLVTKTKSGIFLYKVTK